LRPIALESAWFQLLDLSSDILVSNFGFTFNLYRYTVVGGRRCEKHGGGGARGGGGGGGGGRVSAAAAGGGYGGAGGEDLARWGCTAVESTC
jgi:hypothetical protein